MVLKEGGKLDFSFIWFITPDTHGCYRKSTRVDVILEVKESNQNHLIVLPIIC